MQLSAANLLIAAQQLSRGAARPPADGQTPFASALAKEKGADAASFEPMDFKPATAARPSAVPLAQAPAPAYNAGTRLGANLDIRV
ncbi:MAG: hypothetical protein WDM91_21130 [Rhizomicrobium sp.]